MGKRKIAIQNSDTGEISYLMTEDGSTLYAKSSGLKILTDINMSGNAVDNIVISEVDDLPTIGKEGQITYYDGSFYCCNGKTWSKMSIVGEETIDEGEIFNDYDNNRAISKHSVSHGSNNLAGAKAFKITAFGTTDSKTYTLDSIEGLEVGDIFSLHLKNEYDNQGKITEINTSTKTITVDNFKEAETATEGNPVLNIFRIAAKPEVGTTDFAEAAFAEGSRTKAVAKYAHAEGVDTTVIGNNGHAEGRETVAVYAAHAEGERTKAMGYASHTEGANTQATAQRAHAEGEKSIAANFAAHAEGENTQALAWDSHTEGKSTVAKGDASHAEGKITTTGLLGLKVNIVGHDSDSTIELSNDILDKIYVDDIVRVYELLSNKPKEIVTVINKTDTTLTLNKSIQSGQYKIQIDGKIIGTSTIGLGNQGHYAHAEGINTIAAGSASHSEGKLSYAIGNYSHAEGKSNTYNNYAHSEGLNTVASGEASHVEGSNNEASGKYSHAEGESTVASNETSHSEGSQTKATGQYAHAEGKSAVASGNASHAEGGLTVAAAYGSHAEGDQTNAKKNGSHAEGYKTNAEADAAHSEGSETIASGAYSHAEGGNTISSGNKSHAEGANTTAQGGASHAEGGYTKAIGHYSHAEGYNTITNNDYQHVEGKYNIEDTNNKYVHIIGNGSINKRSNAHTIDWNGNAWFAGKVTTGSTQEELATKSYVDSVAGSGGGGTVTPTFSNYTVGTEYTGNDGLCKFSIKGQNAKITPETPGEGFIQAYYYLTSSMRGKTPVLPHTQANICLNGGPVIDLGDMYGISGTYKFGDTSYTVEDVYDEYTQSQFIQRISNDWFPKADYLTEDCITLDGKNGVVFELRIPESAFGEQIPYKNSPEEYIPTVCPMSRMISEKHLLSLTTHDQLYNQYMSFAWHEPNSEGSTEIEKSGYYSLHLSSKTDGSTKATLRTALFWSKWFIRYTLAEPIIKKNSAKLYINSGDTVTLQTKTDGYDAIVNYIQTPDNIASSTKGIEFLSEDINDLNKRVENVEISEASVGYPDGVSDNYDTIVALLDANTNSGVNKVIDFPAGTYYVSKPIVISTPHTTLRGNGEVIIKCPTGQPGFIIAANYVEVRGFTFWISKTEDTASIETDNGLHCGIFVDSGKGTYNTKIIDCDFQGAYRLSTKNIERSYGIYIPNKGESVVTSRDWGFAYFNIIDNCRFYALYCGLYLGDCVQPSKVWFSFDAGDNIYNISDIGGSKPTNALGCGYGCICKGSFNVIRFDGQFIGDDSTIPTNVVFETIDGVKKVKSATITNLSVCGIKVEGGANYIEGYAYDGQRADKGQLWFTKTASSNRFVSLWYGSTYRFSDSVTFTATYKVYDTDGTEYEWKTYKSYRYLIDENGSNYSIGNNPRMQNTAFLGSSGISAVASDGTYTTQFGVQHYGTQDNALAYVDKWGGYNSIKPITVRFTDSEGNVTVNDTPFTVKTGDTTTATSDCSSLFRPISNTGFNKNSVTFAQAPTETSPIYMDIHFGRAIAIERIVIKFNEYIAKDFDIIPYTNFTEKLQSEAVIAIRGNNTGQINATTHHSQSGYGQWGAATGMRISIIDALQVGDYNPNGYVGLSCIFALASEQGGMSYLPRGGGKLYGDLNIKDGNIQLSPISDNEMITTATDTVRGAIYNVTDETNQDSLKYCRRVDNDNIEWQTLATTADITNATNAANNTYFVNIQGYGSGSRAHTLMQIPNCTSNTRVVVSYQAYETPAENNVIAILSPGGDAATLSIGASNKYTASVKLDSSGKFTVTPSDYLSSQSSGSAMYIQFSFTITDVSHVFTSFSD